jgi:hypothetical protein
MRGVDNNQTFSEKPSGMPLPLLSFQSKLSPKLKFHPSRAESYANPLEQKLIHFIEMVIDL